jgi:flagellar assembly protein FliH
LSPAAARRKYLFKNLYSSGEYNIKETPYKLRGSFLSKSEKLEKDLQEKPKEISPEQKLAAVNDELKAVESLLAAKKEELFQLELSKEQVKTATEAEVLKMRKDAEEQAEELKTQKQKEGYDSGFEKGYYEGLEKSTAEVEQKYASLLSTMQTLTESALSEKNKVVKSAEDDVVDLSVDIAKKVVDRELETNHDIVVNFVKEAIKALENREKITIYAHPDDIELIKSHREDFKKLTDLTDTLHILPDDMLSRGECRLESESEIVDTDINYQFGEIRKKLHSSE